MTLSEAEREPVEQLAARLARNTPKSTALAARFLEAAPLFRQRLSHPQLARLGAILEKVAAQSVDYAAACLEALEAAAISLDSPAFKAFIELSEVVTETSWIELKTHLQQGP